MASSFFIFYKDTILFLFCQEKINNKCITSEEKFSTKRDLIRKINYIKNFIKYITGIEIKIDSIILSNHIIK